MQNNQDDLTTSLPILNKHLYEGFILKRHFHAIYDEDPKEESVDVKKFQKEYEDEINKWLGSVAGYIFERFEKHLYFHFVQPKADALSFTHPLGGLTHALEKHLFALEDVIVRLEEQRNLTIRQEIAEKEYQTDLLYKVTYSTHTREVKINNIVLSKPDFDSENDRFFEYVSLNPNRPIGLEELTQHMGSAPAKRLAHIVRDLGFTGELKSVFFPVVTKSQVMFINPVNKQYAQEHDLPAINFKKIGRQSETE